MNFLKNLNEEGLRPRDFIFDPARGKVTKEFSISIHSPKRSHNQLSIQTAMFRGLWGELGLEQEMLWEESSLLLDTMSLTHRRFIDRIIERIITDKELPSIRISMGKHVNPSMSLYKTGAYQYEKYIDLDLDKIRAHGSSDIIHAVFYSLFGYNTYGTKVKKLIYSEEESWKESNTDHTAHQDLIQRLVLSGLKDSISPEILEIPAPTSLEEGM
jgi:hypothetical protein